MESKLTERIPSEAAVATRRDGPLLLRLRV
jgi:hypothetical protein